MCNFCAAITLHIYLDLKIPAFELKCDLVSFCIWHGLPTFPGYEQYNLPNFYVMNFHSIVYCKLFDIVSFTEINESVN